MNIKLRLTIMNFMQFAVWGAYLTCMGNYLISAGMAELIPWFYAIQGIVSIFMPAIMGIVADKFIQPQRLLGLCHLIAGRFMGGCWWLGMQSATPDPTLFSGFIATMWFVNCAYIGDSGIGFTLGGASTFQYTYWQFFVSGLLSLLLFVYCFTLPQCPIIRSENKSSIVEALGLNAFSLFKNKNMAIFFIFSMLLGMCLQVTNGYAGPYISSFQAIDEFRNSFGAQNPTLLTSLSQISEALCILLIPFFLKRYGIKVVMSISMVAWVLRFGCFGLGNPGGGLWLFIISMIVYGVAFDFFNVSGALYIEKEADKSIQASAQGLFMLMTNGLGATIGTLSAGAVVKHFCHQEGDFLVGDWASAWYTFSAFALVVAVLFIVLFKYKHVPEKA